MQIEYRLLTPPATEPLTLAEAKAWLKVDYNDEDSLIDLLISAARERCESFTGLSLVSQQWVAYLPYWPMQSPEEWWDGMRQGAFIYEPIQDVPLRHGPVRQIDAFTLYDEVDNSTEYPAENYLLDRARDALVLKSGAPIPTGTRMVNLIEITYTAGFDTVPGAIKAGLLKLITHLYEHRGDEINPIPGDIQALWQPYRRRTR
jgi:hypothetical protein